VLVFFFWLRQNSDSISKWAIFIATCSQVYLSFMVDGVFTEVIRKIIFVDDEAGFFSILRVFHRKHDAWSLRLQQLQAKQFFKGHTDGWNHKYQCG
jgi:hypothetical protein